MVRERYAAIARDAGSCCEPGCCGPEMAPDGLNVIGDAYAGIEGRLAEADLNLGCGVPTRHAALKPGEAVLDLGSGAGNDVFIARREVGPTGHVVGVDMTPDMVARARANAFRLGYGNVELKVGDGYYGWPERGPFDAIIVTAAAGHVPPPLVAQLKPGGRMVIPVGAPFHTQELVLLTKDADGRVAMREILPVAFVALTGGPGR